jgi:hypothetical protein
MVICDIFAKTKLESHFCGFYWKFGCFYYDLPINLLHKTKHIMNVEMLRILLHVFDQGLIYFVMQKKPPKSDTKSHFFGLQKIHRRIW